MDWCGNNRRELVDIIEIPNTQVNILKINALKIKANIIGKSLYPFCTSMNHMAQFHMFLFLSEDNGFRALLISYL